MVHFVHVGIQKTGSTWLQTGLFSHHPQLNVIGSRPLQGAVGSQLQAMVIDLYRTPSDEFDPTRWLNRFNGLISDMSADDRLVGLSNEQLSGWLNDSGTGFLVADRLQVLFGEIRIILVLRNPVTYLSSVYAQLIKNGQSINSLDDFLCDERTRVKLAERINYAVLVERYRLLFGRNNLLILPYELLQVDQDMFLKEICNFLGVQVMSAADIHLVRRPYKNERLSAFSTRILKHANRVDRGIERVTGIQNQLLNRSLRWLIKHNPLDSRLPRIPDINPVELRHIPDYARLLQDENYEFWQGELSQFNYHF